MRYLNDGNTLNGENGRSVRKKSFGVGVNVGVDDGVGVDESRKDRKLAPKNVNPGNVFDLKK